MSGTDVAYAAIGPTPGKGKSNPLSLVLAPLSAYARATQCPVLTYVWDTGTGLGFGGTVVWCYGPRSTERRVCLCQEEKLKQLKETKEAATKVGSYAISGTGKVYACPILLRRVWY
eukprot:2647786-Rhodomonas_salina.1